LAHLRPSHKPSTIPSPSLYGAWGPLAGAPSSTSGRAAAVPRRVPTSCHRPNPHHAPGRASPRPILSLAPVTVAATSSFSLLISSPLWRPPLIAINGVVKAGHFLSLSAPSLPPSLSIKELAESDLSPHAQASPSLSLSHPHRRSTQRTSPSLAGVPVHHVVPCPSSPGLVCDHTRGSRTVRVPSRALDATASPFPSLNPPLRVVSSKEEEEGFAF
jgi:hypothetical protein